jgi:hypothetical protein
VLLVLLRENIYYYYFFFKKKREEKTINVIHPSVHPVEAPPATDAANGAGPRGRMKDIQGMPGTAGGLALRFSQFAFAVLALCVMATTSDFPSVTAFRYPPPLFFSFFLCRFFYWVS